MGRVAERCLHLCGGKGEFVRNGSRWLTGGDRTHDTGHVHTGTGYAGLAKPYIRIHGDAREDLHVATLPESFSESKDLQQEAPPICGVNAKSPRSRRGSLSGAYWD